MQIILRLGKCAALFEVALMVANLVMIQARRFQGSAGCLPAKPRPSS
jgi:hypothetical protein